MGLAGFAAMRALSERNDDPTARQPAVRPRPRRLRAQRRRRHAGARRTRTRQGPRRADLRRGARLRRQLPTAATSPQPDEDGTGAANAMAHGPERRRRRPGDVDYINAHGTSTPLGDKAETTAIKTVFNEHARKVSISSTKSQLGHLLGASGGVELIFCLLALRDGVIPPTINYDTPDPELRSGLHAQPGPAAEALGGHVQQLRLRRPQRLAGRRPTAQRLTDRRVQRAGVASQVAHTISALA